MSISAAPSAVDRFYRQDDLKFMLESAKPFLSTAVSFNQGDLMYLDTSAHLIKRVAASANAATFLGVAVVSVASGQLVGPYTGLTPVTPAIQDCSGPAYGITATMKL